MSPRKWKFLHVSFSPNMTDIASLETVFNAARDWYRYAPNCWLLFTSMKAESWITRVRNIPGMERAYVFVCPVDLGDDDTTGWVPQEVWNFLRKHRPELDKISRGR